MNPNIYPRNYFTPYEDFEQSPEEIPGLAPEIKADEDAFNLFKKIRDKHFEKSLVRLSFIDYKKCLYEILSELELEHANILEELYKLKGE